MSTVVPHPRSPLRSWLGVAAITASLFTFVTTEMMPIGLLTPMSSSLHVALGIAGLMVTLYGVSAGLGVPLVVAWTRHVDRRMLLTALLAILAVGNLITAAAPDFALVMASRLIMGFANGAFWAIGVSMAMRLVPGQHANRAASIALSGISIATVVGIPLGTFLASLSSWRTTFLIWSGLSTLVLVAVAVTIPSLPSDNAVPVREVFELPRANVRLRQVMVTVVLYVLGHYGAYTFVRPFMEKEAHASSGFITGLLMVFGAGGAIGNFGAEYLIKKNLKRTYLGARVTLVASLLALLGLGHSQAGALIAAAVWGLAFGAANLCQINLVLAAAPDKFEAAMSVNTLGFNVSIALGALIGGVFADRSGVAGAVWFGAVLTAASALVSLVSRREAAKPAAEEALVAAG